MPDSGAAGIARLLGFYTCELCRLSIKFDRAFQQSGKFGGRVADHRQADLIQFAVDIRGIECFDNFIAQSRRRMALPN